MSYEIVKISRQQLYDAIWSEPLRTVAQRYNVSDVGLAKLCRRFNIPRPGRGYWQRKCRGRSLPPPPLPNLEDGRGDTISITRRKKLTAGPEQDNEALAMIASESREESQILVPAKADNLHPLVARTEKSLHGAKGDDRGLVKPRAKRCLDVEIGRDSLDRAVRIMDTLIKALESRGHFVTVEDEPQRTMKVAVLEESLQFRLEESVLGKAHELTPTERRRRERNPWALVREYDFEPAGKLALRITGEYGLGVRMTWADGKRQRIEDRLNSFVVGLVNAAVRKQAQRLERERQEREWEEARRQRDEKVRLIREEKERLQALEAEAENWHKSQSIRAYLEAVRRDAIREAGEIPVGGELEQWLEWAARQADRLDPLVDSPPSVLDEEDDYRYLLWGL